jgi:hypothetical protein
VIDVLKLSLKELKVSLIETLSSAQLCFSVTIAVESCVKNQMQSLRKSLQYSVYFIVNTIEAFSTTQVGSGRFCIS